MRVYYASPWIPAEWIQAHGLEPWGIWHAQDLGTKLCPLRDGICPFAQTVQQFAEAHPGSAIIFSTHCDQLRRGFDAVSQSGPVFLFNLPATWQTPAAEKLFILELQRLSRFLVKLAGRTPSNELLSKTMAEYAQARKRLLALAPTCPGQPFADALAHFHSRGPGATSERRAPVLRAAGHPSPGAIPLALIGGPLPSTHWSLYKAIACAGGSVVLNATETGERTLCITPDNILSVDPLSQLARAYLAGCADVFQRPNTRLCSWLQERLTARKVRGIILWHFLGCDLWRAEAQTLREAFGLPLLALDATEQPTVSLRDAGRLEAFMESLR